VLSRLHRLDYVDEHTLKNLASEVLILKVIKIATRYSALLIVTRMSVNVFSSWFVETCGVNIAKILNVVNGLDSERVESESDLQTSYYSGRRSVYRRPTLSVGLGCCAYV
jgi:hypothetical protein